MPSCSGAEFEVIERYLSLRDQIDYEDDSYPVDPDQKLPQFSASFLGGSDPEVSSSSSSPAFTFPAMDSTGEPWPMNFLLPGTSPDPLATTATPASLSVNPLGPGSQTTSYIFSGSGCTVTETSPQGVGVPFPEDPLSSPELYDLDKHTASFYDKEGGVVGGGGGYSGGKAEIKMEQMEEFHHHHDALSGGGMDRLNHHPHHHHNHLEETGMLQEDQDDLSTFMIQSLRDDIISDCKELGISTDPRTWTERDTLTWVNSVLRRDIPGCPPFCGDPALLHVLSVPGEVLCHMSMSEFQRCLPRYGGYLHQRLEIWRIAMDFTSFSPEPTQPQWYSSKQHPHHPHHPATTTITTTTINNNFAHAAPLVSDYRGGAPRMPPSISPAPSTDSTCSTLSHSSSSSSSLGGGRGRGGSHPHMSAGYGPSQDRLEGEVFGLAASTTAAVAATTRRKPPQAAASHHHPTPAHLPAPPRGPRAGKQTIHLWQFLRELLDNTENYHDCIKWTDRARGVFKIEDSSKVARLWGRRKNRPAMNYDKLSRSVRQYYKKGIIRKTEQSKRLVYQFCQPYL